MSSGGYFFMDVVAVLILGAALAYGTISWRKRPRDPATRAASDEATRRLYRSEDSRR